MGRAFQTEGKVFLDCRKVAKHALKSYDFFSCRKRLVRRLHATKSYRVNRSLESFSVLSLQLLQLLHNFEDHFH